MRSGLSTGRRGSRLWPPCPPLVFPDRPRRLLSTRGGFFRPSLDGGLLLLELFLSSRRRSSATCCFSAAFSWWSAVFSSRRLSTSRRSAPISSAMVRVLSTPVLTHGRARHTSEINTLRKRMRYLWLFGLTTGRHRGAWELLILRINWRDPVPGQGCIEGGSPPPWRSGRIRCGCPLSRPAIML